VSWLIAGDFRLSSVGAQPISTHRAMQAKRSLNSKFMSGH